MLEGSVYTAQGAIAAGLSTRFPRVLPSGIVCFLHSVNPPECPRTSPLHIHTSAPQDRHLPIYPAFHRPLFTVSRHQRGSIHCPRASTLASTSPYHAPETASTGPDMCWLTLTPAKGKQHRHDHHSANSSCVEELVRVHRSPSPRFREARVKVPSSVTMELEGHHHLHPHLHHHHKHHLHPLHLHPVHGHRHHDLPALRLRGPGRKRCPPPPGPPPPSRDASRSRPCPPSPSPVRPREPIYRTQIVEPAQVRETTRVALRSGQSERQRGRLRRVAGYELLGREVPWNWDCISSTVGSSSAGGGKWATRKRGALRYPPFGSMDRWL